MTKIDFIVLENLPFDVLIGRPTLITLGAVLDFKSAEVRLDAGGTKSTLPMVSEYERPHDKGDETASEDFTSESSDGEDMVYALESDDEELVLAIGKDIEVDDDSFKLETEIQIEDKLKHLPENISLAIATVLKQSGVVAESLYYLRQADVPV